MSAIATAIVGTAVVGAVVSDQASKRAAHQAALAAGQANQIQGDQYAQNREDMAPWRTAGGQAVGQLSDLTGPNGAWSKDFSASDFQKDPGYEFRMAEGQKALERSAAARGGVLGGATLRSLTRYNQDYGSQEYDKAYNRFMNNRSQRFNQLAAIAGLGQTANGQLAQVGMNTANNQSNNLMGAANMQGAAGIASANAWSGALNNGINNWMTYMGAKK